MEGPSLVLTCEEFSVFFKERVIEASGSARIPFDKITGSYLKNARSWGKHLILEFADVTLRIHFLMFGSYRLDDPRDGREPKLLLEYGDHKVYFYSCAIKELPKGWEKTYDWSIDLMAPEWDAPQALANLRAKAKEQVSDLLMDQQIFSGLGNIMKNEILYNLRMHPETKFAELSPAKQRALVRESESYAWQFYEWKKENVLMKNWKIMRKKICPRCEGPVCKKKTGKLQRWSHFCPHCQPRETTAGRRVDVQAAHV